MPAAKGAPIQNDVWDVIQKRLDELGWKPSRLVDDDGISHQSLSNFRLHGRRPAPRTLLKIAAKLTMPIDPLMHAAGYATPPAGAGSPLPTPTPQIAASDLEQRVTALETVVLGLGRVAPDLMEVLRAAEAAAKSD